MWEKHRNRPADQEPAIIGQTLGPGALHADHDLAEFIE